MLVNLYISSLCLAGLMSLGLSWYARRQHSAQGSGALAWLAMLTATWAFALMGESLADTVSMKVFWSVLTIPGNQLAAVSFFVFVLRYTQQDRWLTWKGIALLSVFPTVSVAVAATNHWHRLWWPTITLQFIDGHAVGSYAHGVWFYLGVAYSYTFVALGIGVLLRAIFRYPEYYSKQSRLILLASVLPFLLNALYVFNSNILSGFDPTVIVFSLSGVFLLRAITRHGLLEVAPVSRYRVVDIIREGVLVFDTNCRLVDCNPSGRRIFGWEQPPLGQPATVFWASRPDLLALLQAQTVSSAEISLPHDDQTATFDINMSLVYNRDGEVNGRVLLVHDVTAHRQAEAQMYLQAAALSAADNGIVITDLKGIIQWVNPALTRLTGFEAEELLGYNTRIFKSGKYTDEFYRQLWETVRAGQVWRGEMINRRKNGSFYYEDMTVTPLVQPDGQITHFIAVKQDISARKEGEEALKEAHQQALEANRLKTQLLANVSHDLRTPLSAIMGYADMLRSGVFGRVLADQKEALSEIIDSSNQLLIFVNNLIGQAQIETGKIVLRPRLFEPWEMVDSAQSTASLLAKKKGLTFESHIAPEFPQQVIGDPYWLRQILLNLVYNAIKFTEEGGVTISLLQPDSDHWAMRISDTGIGIPEEARAYVFEAFRQVDGSATRRHGGSGLGLSIVRELVSLMNGSIDLSSEVGKGSSFTVTLPFEDNGKSSNAPPA